MKTKTILAAVTTFTLGCVAAPLIVPRMSAQQAAVGVQRWEGHCARAHGGLEGINRGLMQMGAQGWELVSYQNSLMCFKRPL